MGRYAGFGANLYLTADRVDGADVWGRGQYVEIGDLSTGAADGEGLVELLRRLAVRVEKNRAAALRAVV